MNTPSIPPSEMKLRDYQIAAVDSIFDYFKNGKIGNPLVALPTGTGKSVVIADFIKKSFMMYPGQRYMKLTHVKELIGQNYRTLMRHWPQAPAGIYSSGLQKWEAHYPITFAGIASVVNSPEMFGRIDLIFIDEAHLVSPKDGTMYQKFINAMKATNPYLKVVGFTATHYRLGQGLLTEPGSIFTDVCFNMTDLNAFNWLLDEGYLCPLIPKRTGLTLDVSNVGTVSGEFNQKELQHAVDKDEVTYKALREAAQLGQDRNHWLIFASGVDHAVHIRDMLESMGITATCVHSRMASSERDENIAGFLNGQYRAMVNNGILTTGFDFPAMDMIVMLRPTQSPGLWVQMLGRGTRPVYTPGFDLETKSGRLASQQVGPKKNCLVLDFAGNTARLGPINDPVLPRKKGHGSARPAPVKLCETCGTYNHTRATFCINCQAVFVIQTKLDSNASTGELIRKANGLAPVDLPKMEWFPVSRVTYTRHEKEGRPPSMKVTYYCGLRRFEEWICFEHEGFAKRKAHQWWIARCDTKAVFRSETEHEWVPVNVKQALEFSSYLRIPRSVKVWVNKKYPEIVDYGYIESVPPNAGSSSGAV